jgi:hypothetical protein
MITSPSVMMVSLVSLVVALVAVGAAKARRLTGSAPGAARRFGTYVAGGLAVWLALTAALAQFGTLSVWSALPPRLPLLPLCAFAVFLTLGRTAVVKTLIANSPRSWPIAAQTFRVGVELNSRRRYRAGPSSDRPSTRSADLASSSDRRPEPLGAYTRKGEKP